MAVNFTAFDLAAYIIITLNCWLSICTLQYFHVLCMVR